MTNEIFSFLLFVAVILSAMLISLLVIIQHLSKTMDRLSSKPAFVPPPTQKKKTPNQMRAEMGFTPILNNTEKKQFINDFRAEFKLPPLTDVGAFTKQLHSYVPGIILHTDFPQPQMIKLDSSADILEELIRTKENLERVSDTAKSWKRAYELAKASEDAFKNICARPNCHDCPCVSTCPHYPGLSQMVRYNCPLHPDTFGSLKTPDSFTKEN